MTHSNYEREISQIKESMCKLYFQLSVSHKVREKIEICFLPAKDN
jgi:hypothetical protein